MELNHIKKNFIWCIITDKLLTNQIKRENGQQDFFKVNLSSELIFKNKSHSSDYKYCYRVPTNGFTLPRFKIRRNKIMQNLIGNRRFKIKME